MYFWAIFRVAVFSYPVGGQVFLNPMVSQDSSSVLDKFQSASRQQTATIELQKP